MVCRVMRGLQVNKVGQEEVEKSGIWVICVYGVLGVGELLLYSVYVYVGWLRWVRCRRVK